MIPQLTNGEDPMTTGPDWDHSGLAQEVELDEATVRACIARIQELSEIWAAQEARYRAAGNHGPYLAAPSYGRAVIALEALLPTKPDRAAEIVEDWINRASYSEDDLGSPVERFARYLIKEGMLK
jgi:hypothetical protein